MPARRWVEMAKRVVSNEMFQRIDGEKVDAFLHAAILGDDEDFCYDLMDLPPSGPYTDEDIDRARALYRQRRAGKSR